MLVSFNMLHNFVLICLLLTFGAADAGLKLRVTNKGVQQALRVAETAVNDRLASTKMPGVRLQMQLGPGKARLDVRKLLVTDFEPPRYGYQPLPPSGAQWSATDGTATIKGAWTAVYSYLVKVSFDGFFIATAKNLSMTAAVEVVRGEDGRAEVRVPSCRADVDSMRVKFIGGAIPKIMNALRGAMEEALEGAVRSKVCSLVQSVLVTRVNAQLRSTSPHVPLNFTGGRLKFNYDLTANPIVTQQYVDAFLNGTITDARQMSSLELVPRIMPESHDDVDSMVYLWAADTVPQSLFNSLFEADLIKFEINRNSTPQYANGLRTTCTLSECLGSKRKAIGELFPDTFGLVEIWASRPPTVSFQGQRILLGAQLWAKVYVEPKSNDTLCYVLRVDAQAKARPFFKNKKLTAKLTFEAFTISVNESRVGNVTSIETYFLADIVSSQIQEKVNQRLNRNPINILPLENVELESPSIAVLDGVIELKTDFRYVVATKSND